MSNTRSESQIDQYLEFQGGSVANVPERPGLYAWYYRPTTITRQLTTDTLARFFMPESTVTTFVSQRYGMKIVSRAMGEMVFGSEEEPGPEAISAAFGVAEPFLKSFFRSRQFVHFCRPVYIGIAKNLYDRIYNQHFLSLVEYWDDSSRVSRFLSANSKATVQRVIDALDLQHSFALEARVRGIPSTDLMVAVLPTDNMPADIGSDDTTAESATRRGLERLLQLLSDPICGRR
jgi:hypothetical protein